MAKKNKNIQVLDKKQVVKVNNLAGIISGLIGMKAQQTKSGNNINNLSFLKNQLRSEFLTLDRSTCSLLYSQFGTCQSIAEVPVRDAYRNGVRLQVFSRDITPKKDLDSSIPVEKKEQKTGLIKALTKIFNVKENEEDKDTKESKKENYTNRPIEEELIRKRREWDEKAKELDKQAKEDTDTNLRTASPRWKVKALEIAAKEYDIISLFEQANIWKRVFGGAGIIIDTPTTAGNYDKPLELDKLKKGDKLNFIVADCWELQGCSKNISKYTGNQMIDWSSDCPFTYMGKKIHKSRVLIFKGKEIPSMYRGLGRGFGLSYFEHIVRSLNKAYKAQNSRAELLDDAKTNVVKFKGLKDIALDSGLEAQLSARMSTMEYQKNYSGTISLDSEDEWAQKQVSFSNFAEMQADDRVDVAADTRIQLTKLYGMTPAGFNSGDSDRATYEDMVRAEVQIPDIPNLIAMYKILARVTLGESVDVDVDFNPLTKQSDRDTVDIKQRKLDHILKLYSYGLVTPAQVASYANENDLGDGIEFNPELPITPDITHIRNYQNTTYKTYEK